MTLRRAARDAVQRLLTPLRRRHYVDERAVRAVRILPGPLRRAAGLEDRSAVGSRRLEIGGGPFPQEGFIHVDADRRARHLEARAPAWRLPFDDGWAREIVAVHSLEHVHPGMLLPTLREWHRLLEPGGEVRVHVPNAPQLLESFRDSPVDEKWRTMGALLGMYSHPGVRSPEELEVPADHQLMFDPDLLRWALESAGFREVTDLTDEVRDKHTEAWREVVPRFSLVARARR